MGEKGPDAFRTISEASAEVGAPAHVLRFWETKFTFIRPVRRAGGQRFYRPRDIDLLCAVRRRLHEDGFSIRDVQRLSRAALLGVGALDVSAHETTPSEGPSREDRLQAALLAALAAKIRLDGLLHR